MLSSLSKMMIESVPAKKVDKFICDQYKLGGSCTVEPEPYCLYTKMPNRKGQTKERELRPQILVVNAYFCLR